VIYKKCSVMEDILAGMKNSKQQMIEDGLWNDKVTFEALADFAGSHIEIKEVPKSST